MKKVLSFILSLSLIFSAVTVLTALPTVAETVTENPSANNLFPDAGFENATLGVTNHEIFKDRVLYSDKEEGASIGELLSLQGLNIDVE